MTQQLKAQTRVMRFSLVVMLEKLYSHMQNNEIRPPHRKINIKWTKGLNIRHETIKITEKNIDDKFFNTGFSDVFLNISPKAKETKAKANK